VPTDGAGAEPARSEGHGRRLTTAFAALEGFPALSESRLRVLSLFDGRQPSLDDLARVVESDVALAISTLRLANRTQVANHGYIDTAALAIEALPPGALLAIATRARTYDFFDRGGSWREVPERFRLHAVATQRAADRLACELSWPHRDRLAMAALLHDIGKLVLVHAYPEYPAGVHGDAATPEHRIQAERRVLGVDHAMVGGVLARRWGLPASLAGVIEAHHGDATSGDAQLVRLADMLAHYMLGDAVTPAELLKVSHALGLKPAQLRTVMYELPLPGSSTRARRTLPCPLSTRELDVVRALATGKVYKQIAADLGLSPSTVRTHLHNTYRKLETSDRAQAVLLATERGWI
jgi:putative nucleotidyltransferase with HDIG domain